MRLGLLCIAFGIATAFPAAALAAPPSNDDFANAQNLGGGSTATASGTNVDATAESGEPDHLEGMPATASVWYRWTAPASGQVRIDTCGSDFDTVLAVYTGSALNTLTQVASNDDSCGLQSRVRFNATAGTTYRIAVDGFFGEQGSIELGVAPAPPPPNDDFADVQNLGGGSTATASGTNVDATAEPGEPDHLEGVPPTASVWYRWTAPANGDVRIDTCGSDFDTVLAVYTGSAINALTPVASNDDSCGLQSTVRFDATAGTTYRIAVDGLFGEQGSIELEVALVTRPTNDDFADAQNLGGGSTASASGTNVDATAEPGEPDHYKDVPATASVWYRWTAPASGEVRIDTCGSNFDTVLAAYKGSALGALTQVASNDDSCGLQSRVAFDATAGTTYRIAVDGLFGEEGSIELELAPPPPSNEFDFGKVKKNKKKGTAKLTVKVPGPGELDLAKTKKVKADEERAEAAGKEKLRVKPKGKAKKKLNTRGEAKVKAKVTFTPDGGEPNTQSKKVKLVKR